MKISLKDIKENIENINIINYDPEVFFSKFCHDTRELESNSLYIPIVGENTDGHIYIKDALKGGSSISLCQNDKKEFVKDLSSPIILCNDVLETLGEIINLFMQNIHKNAKVIAVTGSTGKTTTREMISSVLSENGKVLHSERNFNTLWGNAEIIDDFTDEKYIVLEFGIDAKEEMERLCRSIRPDCGVFQNVGVVHSSKIGSIEDIFEEKSKLVEFLNQNNGFLAFNIDDPLISSLKGSFKGENLSFGRNSEADIKIVESSVNKEGTKVKIEYNNNTFNIYLKVYGKEYAYNACASVAVGLHLGLSEEQIINGLEKYQGFSGRFEIWDIDDNVSIVNDAYNANPASMKMSIETFTELFKDTDKQKFLILGDMRELGDYTETEHKKIAELVKSFRYPESNVFFLGQYFKFFDYGTELNSIEEVTSLIEDKIKNKENAIILLKGSHGTELYKVAKLFTPSNISS